MQPLAAPRVEALLSQVAGWRAQPGGQAIRRDFRFPDFQATVSFINALAWLAHRQGHHPDFRAGADYCHVSFTTHAIGGLSENDFICAARLNALTET